MLNNHIYRALLDNRCVFAQEKHRPIISAWSAGSRSAIVTSMICVLCCSAAGQTTQPIRPSSDLLHGSDVRLPVGTVSRDEARRLAPSVALMLESEDVAIRGQAITYLRNLLLTPEDVADGIQVWGKPLLKAGECDLLEQLCRVTIIQKSYDTPSVVYAQGLRVDAFSKQHNFSVALLASLSYANIAALDQAVAVARRTAEIMKESGDPTAGEKFVAKLLAQENWSSRARGSTAQSTPKSIATDSGNDG